MSYIRSTSNPEGLYIYGDGEHIIIHHPHGTSHVLPRDFERVGLRYLESPALAVRRIKSGGLSLREVTLFHGTERICSTGHEDRCMAQKLKAGVIWANTYNKFDPTSPFGGYKESGFGREGGLHGLAPYVVLS